MARHTNGFWGLCSHCWEQGCWPQGQSLNLAGLSRVSDPRIEATGEIPTPKDGALPGKVHVGRATLYRPEVKGREDVYEDLKTSCECTARNQSGFRGPCSYCWKQEHRNQIGPREQDSPPRVSDSRSEAGKVNSKGGYQPEAQPDRYNCDQRPIDPGRGWNQPGQGEDRGDQSNRERANDGDLYQKGDWGLRPWATQPRGHVGKGEDEVPEKRNAPIDEDELGTPDGERATKMAYVEAYLRGSNQPAGVTVDSENLVGDLVSKAFADSLGLQYRPDRSLTDTLPKGGRLKAVGVCDPMQIRLAGIDRAFMMRPLVVDGLFREMNVGRDFLGRHHCTLDFSSGGGELQVKGQSMPLLRRSLRSPTKANGPATTPGSNLELLKRRAPLQPRSKPEEHLPRTRRSSGGPSDDYAVAAEDLAV